MMQQPEPKIAHAVHENQGKSIEVDLMIEKQKEKIREITLDKFADADKAFKHMHSTHEPPAHVNPKLSHIESRYKSKPKELTSAFTSMEKRKRKDLLQSVKQMNMRLLHPPGTFKTKRPSTHSRSETHRSKKKIQSVSDILRT